MLWEVCAGLRMDLVSETEEQRTPPAEATARTRCLAMFSTPIRERAAMNRERIAGKYMAYVDAGVP